MVQRKGMHYGGISRGQYVEYLNEVGIPELDKKSNGGMIADTVKYGNWMRRNRLIEFEVGFNEWSAREQCRDEKESRMRLTPRGMLPIGTLFYYSGNGIWLPSYGKITGYIKYQTTMRYKVRYDTKRYPKASYEGEVSAECFEPHPNQKFKTISQLHYEAHFEEMLTKSPGHP